MSNLGMTMQQITDFLKGQRDCEQGVEHKAGQSKFYDRGYSVQYEMEQVLTVNQELLS